MQSADAEQRFDDADTISHGALTVNLRGFSVTIGGRDIALTRAEFLLLVALARDPYNVLGREALINVLRDAHLGREGEHPTLRAVDVHIARLRRKLGAAGHTSIKTMRNVGYRFVPP